MVGSALTGEPVALRPTRDAGLWDVYYCQQRVGRIDEREEGIGSRLLRRRRVLVPLAPADAADAAE